MPVAKSYQNFEKLTEPYVVNNKTYIKLRDNKGKEKQVRWYSDSEYYKMYPEERKVQQFNGKDSKVFTPKEVLGFQNGYITIFRGDTYKFLDWFKASNARYTNRWGWYVVSTEEVPEDLPVELTSLRLDWSLIGFEGGNLKPEEEIKQAVEELLYANVKSNSKHMGSVGERIEVTVVVSATHSLENQYGTSTIHTMVDDNENEYIWITASKNWQKGTVKTIRGTVKEHKVYKGVKQTVLTRCSER